MNYVKDNLRNKIENQYLNTWLPDWALVWGAYTVAAQLNTKDQPILPTECKAEWDEIKSMVLLEIP